MSISTAICNSFKLECYQRIHDLGNDVIKAALYTDAAQLDQSTIAYTTDGEAVGDGYVAGGVVATVLAGYPALNGNFAEVRFEPITFDPVSLTYRGLMLYNATRGNRAIGVYDRGENITTVNGPIIIDVPLSELAMITST